MNSLCAKFLRAEYCSGKHPNKVEITSATSHIWCRLICGKDLGDQQIRLTIRNVEADPFFERWIPGLVIERTQSNGHIRHLYVFVNADGTCNHQKIVQYLGHEDDNAIREANLCLQGDRDSLYLSLTALGSISLSSAWNSLRAAQVPDGKFIGTLALLVSGQFCYGEPYGINFPQMIMCKDLDLLLLLHVTVVKFDQWRLLIMCLVRGRLPEKFGNTLRKSLELGLIPRDSSLVSTSGGRENINTFAK